MALAYDTTSTGNANLSTSMSWSHTASGSDRIVLVSCSFQNTVTSLTATYGGNSMTQIFYANNVALFYYIAPSTSSQTVSVSWTNSAWCEGYAVSLTGAAQSSPIGASNTTTASSTTSISLALTTTAANSMVVSVGKTDGIYASVSATGTNQTLRNSSKANGQCWGMISTQTTTSAGSYTAGFSSSVFNQTWYMGSAEVKEVGGGGGGPTAHDLLLMGAGV